jgi:hypothetical protein
MDQELTRATWRKASRSQGNGACIEVAALRDRRVAVRDSKDADGLAIIMTAKQWRTFLVNTLRRDLA